MRPASDLSERDGGCGFGHPIDHVTDGSDGELRITWIHRADHLGNLSHDINFFQDIGIHEMVHLMWLHGPVFPLLNDGLGERRLDKKCALIAEGRRDVGTRVARVLEEDGRDQSTGIREQRIVGIEEGCRNVIRWRENLKVTRFVENRLCVGRADATALNVTLKGRTQI